MENVNNSQSIQQAELGEIIHELQRGLNSTSDLHTLIQDTSGSSNAQNLIQEIKGCFSRAMTSLSSSNQANEFVNYELQFPYASSHNDSTPSNPRRSRSRVETTSQEKILTENPDDDCYVWRIYGQKEVSNSIYPRIYYECAHKEELNCCATKRVRRLADNPSGYEIVYYGQHTCMQSANGTVPN